MLLTAIIRHGVGWVRFRAEGGLPARLLDEAAARGIPLWHVRRKGIVLHACCAARDYAALRRPARQAGLRLAVEKKRGLPFRARLIRGRWGLAVGAVLAVVLLGLLSGRIWSVTVSGNNTLSEAMLRERAAEWGVTVGAPIDALDIDRIRLDAVAHIDGVAWLTVNLEGSVAHIELLESEPPLPVEETDTPSNLIAAREGWIVRMDVRSGEAMVHIGDAVAPGTLLVSGVSIGDTQLLLRRALGSVVARTERELYVTVPLTENLPAPATPLYRVSLFLFGWEIPLSPLTAPQEPYQTQTLDRFLTADGIALPLGLRHRYLTPQRTVSVTRTSEEVHAEATVRLRTQETTELAGCRVLESRYTAAVTTNGYTLTGHYLCEENIAQEQPLYVKK